MANANTPFGFRPCRGPNGSLPATIPVEVTSSQTVSKGDLVTMATAGTVAKSSAGDGNNVAGVAAHYVGASDTERTLEIWPADSNTEFECQCASAAATDVGACADHVDASAVTFGCGYYPKHGNTDGISQAYLGSSMTVGGSTAQFKILGLVEMPNNAWGAYVKVRVRFAEGHYVDSAGGR